MTRYSLPKGSVVLKCCLQLALMACAWQLPAVCTGAESLFSGDTRPTVVIDPGHGGDDAGSTGLSGTSEKVISLELAKMLAAELKKTARVVLTRQDDSAPGLTDRTAIANKHQASAFISLHTGASFGRQPSGYAVYHYLPFTRDALGGAAETKSPRPASRTPAEWQTAQLAYQKKSEDLARMTCRHLKKTDPDVACKVYGAPLMVLEGSAGPAVLIEPGFLTNPSDEKRMTTAKGQTAIVSAIRDAVDAFLKTPSNP